MPLFVRHHAQGLSVTPAGAEVLREIRSLLDQAMALYDVASSAQSQVRGPVRVGCFTTLAAMVAPSCARDSRAPTPRPRSRRSRTTRKA